MAERPIDPILLTAYAAQAALVAPIVDDPPREDSTRAQSLGVALGRTGATATAAAALDAATPAARKVASARGPVRAEDLLRLAVLELVLAGLDAGVEPDRQALRVAVRALAQVLGERHGGKAIEVRIPPYAAVQIGDGVTHTRGTPPNVVEAQPRAFLDLATGRRAWADVVATGEVRASGSRADLTAYVPLV